jgi:hypothetical protein
MRAQEVVSPAALRGPVAVMGVTLALLLGLGTPVARGVTPGPGWALSSVAQPSNFSNAENAGCETNPDVLCDEYLVTVTNTGAQSTDGSPIVIDDTLPTGVSAVTAIGKDMESGAGLQCKPEQPPEPEEPAEAIAERSKVECTDDGSVPPGDVLYIRIQVTITTNATLAAVTNEVQVEGGGTRAARSSVPSTMPNSVNSVAPTFGPQTFSAQAYGLDGAPDTVAGDHPNLVSTTVDYASVNYAVTHAGSGEAEVPVQEPKTIIINLPMGLVSDPLSAQTCPEADLRERGPGCPAASQVGTVILDEHGRLSNSESEGVSSNLYNMTPEHGYPMEFAFNVAQAGEILMYPRFIPTASGYAFSITVPALPRSGLSPVGITTMFFGDPALHDAELHQRSLEREVGHSVALEQVYPHAMFTNPTQCGSTPSASIEMDSWVQPQQWISMTAPMYGEGLGLSLQGCAGLLFNAQVETQPETTQTDTPSGYTVDVKIPQAPSFAPDLATPDLETAKVELPEGVAIAPPSGEGLTSCPSSGPEGINITHGWTPTGAQPLDPADPEAMEVGADGLPHIAPGHCPSSSRVGTVTIKTPLLAGALTGGVYIAEPDCGGAEQPACSSAAAEGGKMFHLYIEASGSGIVVKLDGHISVSPLTGRMTMSFEEAPEIPFSDFQLQLKGGEHALLVNPQGCPAARTTSLLSPWSALSQDEGTTPSASFQVSGCSSPEPFSPGFLAQTAAPTADASTPFTMTISRHDGEQGLYGFSLDTPPGLLGVLASVPLCQEPQASSGECPSDSQVGHAEVAIGSGAQPVWEAGTAYLTTGYEGAPFGLAIVTPARVGPYNLGDIVVRAAIHIDPHTAALSIDARLPQIVDGVPLRMQTVNVTLDRPGFMINPTNCAEQKISATVTGAQPDGGAGTPTTVSTPFAATGCKGLPFAPKLTALTHASTSKAGGAYLHVIVTAPSGSDNLGKVKVVLPKQMPSRLSTLQKACIAAVFEANPANCPQGSVVGMGTATTPLLKTPLVGPAYVVSHGGAAFPDLEIVLQGEGVTITLDGVTNISKGLTSDAFRALPDAPLTSFQLILPQGPDALLGANANLCTGALSMPTALTSQDGIVLKPNTKIAVSGCPKKKTNAKKSATKGKTAKRAKAKRR